MLKFFGLKDKEEYSDLASKYFQLEKENAELVQKMHNLEKVVKGMALAKKHINKLSYPELVKIVVSYGSVCENILDKED